MIPYLHILKTAKTKAIKNTKARAKPTKTRFPFRVLIIHTKISASLSFETLGGNGAATEELEDVVSKELCETIEAGE